MSSHPTLSGSELEKIHDALSTACACKVKHECETLIGSFREGWTPGNEESTLISLTLLHVTSEAALKSFHARKICPALSGIVKRIGRQSEIVQITLKIYLTTPDNFIRHSCMLTLNSLAMLSESLHSELSGCLDEDVNRFETLLQEERDRHYQLIGFMLSQQSTSNHPQHNPESSCPSPETCEPRQDDNDVLNLRLANTVRKWWSAVQTKHENGSSNGCSHFLLKLWHSILRHCPDVVTFTDHSIDCLLAISTSECAIMSNLALEVLDEGLCSVAMEADLSRTASWVPLLSARVVEASHRGWLQRLPFRDVACGFGGTLREPISSATKREDETFVMGDGRMLRHALLITLKASVACIHEGELEVVTDILSKAFSWVASKTCSMALRLTMEDRLVRTFLDQDDQLMECLLMQLLLHLQLQGPVRNKSSPRERGGVLDPHLLFLHFLASLGSDHTTVVDLVTSNETCALLYFVRYLKLVLSDWDTFLMSHKCFESSTRADELPAEDTTTAVDRTMAVLIRLRMKLERMSRKGLVPFGVSPLLRLIERCESLYEEAS
ncbi:unnamed protein product [Ixodes hexagonus]